MPRPTHTVFALILLFTTAYSIPLIANTACNRAHLAEAASQYLAAQTSGTLTPLQPFLTGNWTYTENNNQVAHTSGVLHKPLSIAHNRTIYDLTLCATYTEVVAPNNPSPYVLGTQIRHSLPSSGDTSNSTASILSIDTISTTTNAWLFNATKTLSYVVKENWFPIPEGQRDARNVIQAAGDAYMDMWSDGKAKDRVPWGTPCVRLEGSAYTGTGAQNDSCTPGIPSNSNQKPNSRRRYVVDEEIGSVSIFCVWEHMMNAADSHEFRLEKGKLRYVHTMTSCGDKVCRL